MKQCNGPCKLEKERIAFGVDRKTIDGLRTVCKNCRNMQNTKYYAANKEGILQRRLEEYHNGNGKIRKKSYSELNKNQIAINAAEYYQDNKEHLLEESNKYYEQHKDERAEYYQENKEYINARVGKYRKERRHTDEGFKLSCALRDRLNDAVSRDAKVGSAVNDLGCSIELFKEYIEERFKDGMTWDNWSLYGWHLDHIIPLSSFDLTDRSQYLRACHYTNLQPLWARDNLSKGNKVP